MNEAKWIYHQELIQLINRGGSTKIELFLSLIGSKAATVNRAKTIVKSYKKANYEGLNANKKTYFVPIYEGDNQYVVSLMQELNSAKIKSELLGAYVHGSLATNEEVNYSDFDALVILKDLAFENPNRLAKVCRKLNQLSQRFYQYDPLQHHGWFVLTESMLDEFPQTYFPPILFEKSKSLLDRQGNNIELKVASGNITDFEQPFYKLATALKKHLQSGLANKNTFALKSIFSQYMLLPALFLQAIKKQGIDKKQSFQIAPMHFETADWEIMDQISRIRKNWRYELTAWQRFWLTNPHYLIRKWGRRYAPKLNEDLAMQLKDISISKMRSLITLMEVKIKEQKDGG